MSRQEQKVIRAQELRLNELNQEKAQRDERNRKREEENEVREEMRRRKEDK